MAEEQELRVVDKRSQSDESKETPPSNGAPKDPVEQKQVEQENAEDQRPMDFPSFIVGIATQAMMLLGEIPEPQSGKLLSPNLHAARQSIDIISVLQEKTKGNLTPDESKLVQDVLTSLRIEFVKKAKK